MSAEERRGSKASELSRNLTVLTEEKKKWYHCPYPKALKLQCRSGLFPFERVVVWSQCLGADEWLESRGNCKSADLPDTSTSLSHPALTFALLSLSVLPVPRLLSPPREMSCNCN